MAQAPTPGVGRREDSASSNRRFVKITLQGETKVLAMHLVPLSEKMAVLRETHMSFDKLVGDDNKTGEISVAVMWWLARRAEGDRSLSWSQVMESWPVGLTNDDIAVDMGDSLDDLADEVGDDHPES